LRQVVAAVIVENSRLLLAQRPPDDALGGLWELPGGKVESGESLQQALERELLEELAMEATAGPALCSAVFTYAHGAFEIVALEVVRRSGYVNLEHSAIIWAGIGDLAGIELAPADQALVAALLDDGVV
jgi:mutator protein MutT